MAIDLINPPDLARPVGYSHGAWGSGKTLFVAGQTGTDKEGRLVSADLVEQFDRALGSVVRVVEEAGGKPEDIAKINLLVVDKDEYRNRAREIGTAYRKHMGRHFPAMTLAEVKGLWDEAKVEIEAIAIL
ncbi:MAG: RidA family protein [Deltaproteobacteria bacterium]|nr:RidA family protein [Deltaproteobacteria bacterium]